MKQPVVSLAAALLLAGCAPTTRAPDRLESVPGSQATLGQPTPSPRASRAARRHLVHSPDKKTNTTSRLLSVTSYCYTGNRTASGVWPAVGQAAMNGVPFGTRVSVPSWGVVKITDRIGHGSDLDLYQPDCAGARRWGRRRVRVVFL